MPMTVKVTAPRLSGALVMHAAAKTGAHAGAEVLLEKANPDVPVESQHLRDSGRVTDTESGSVVGYGFDDGDAAHAPTSAYAVIQHENEDFEHPNGGSWKWLETARSAERAAVLAAAAVPVKAALRA